MPAKKNEVITQSEVRAITRDISTMRYAIVCLQVEAGDRRYAEIARMHPGRRPVGKVEAERIRAIVHKLVDAARDRSVLVDESAIGAR